MKSLNDKYTKDLAHIENEFSSKFIELMELLSESKAKCEALEQGI